MSDAIPQKDIRPKGQKGFIMLHISASFEQDGELLAFAADENGKVYGVVLDEHSRRIIDSTLLSRCDSFEDAVALADISAIEEKAKVPA